MTASIKPLLKQRIESIDILRGLVMLIMAIDHTRDFLHMGHPEPTNLAITTPILFFTRWITHFCAPIFVFLSGVSAYLAGTRRTKSQFSAFLIKRGLWLLVVEFVFITFAITADPGYHMIIFQVIWAIGGSMILLGLLIWLPLPVIGLIGLIIFFGHNILDLVNVGDIGKTLPWKLLLSANGFNSITPIGGGRNLLIAYALLPWTGVMLIGYVFGSLYSNVYNAAKRRRVLLQAGLFLLVLFVVLRTFNIYGDPAPWSVQKTTALSIISFFNVTKYPCSLVYLSMTLSVALITLSQLEGVKNKFTRIVIVYGNVPLFYYVCHWYLLMTINIVVFFAQGFKPEDMKNINAIPPTFGFPLWGVYLTWLLLITILYLPCRWYSQYKRTHTQWWLSYL
ncbi:MAG: heparan-alpha-glucosaminide N-acetyltransferase domain-containing protein [Bacteroidota bacterium]